MMKLVVLYKTPANAQEFDKWYFEEHLPIANKIPGLKGVEISKFAGTPQGKSEYYLMAELYFDNKDSMMAGLMSEEGKASNKDAMAHAKDIMSLFFAEVTSKVPVASC